MLNSVNAIYAQLVREDRANVRARKQRHYPSSACALLPDGRFVGKCRRATWYEWNGTSKTNPPDAPGLFKMQVGDLIHEHLSATLTRALVDLGYLEEHYAGEGKGEEVGFLWQAPGLSFPFSGRLDKRYVAPDGLRMGCEWKSTYGRGADFIKRDGPKDENLLQCAIYLEQDAFPLDAVMLLYACRDSGYVFGYWITKHGDGLKVEHMGSTKVQFSEMGWPAVVRGTAALEEELAIGMIPDRDYREGEWQCNYCAFHDACIGRKP